MPVRHCKQYSAWYIGREHVVPAVKQRLPFSTGLLPVRSGSGITGCLFSAVGYGFFCFVLCFTLSFSAPAQAGTKVMQTEHTVQVGDRETRQDAQRLCYAEAKRKALEQAGVVITAASEVENYTLKQDTVRSLTAAVASAEELGVTWALDGEQLSVTCAVRVSVDEAQLQQQLKKLANAAAADIATSSAGRSGVLTPEGSPARETQLTALVREQFYKGMSLQAAVGVAGEPDMARRSLRAGAEYLCVRYGRAWVVFKEQQALCMRKRLEQRSALGTCHCAGSAASFLWR